MSIGNAFAPNIVIVCLPMSYTILQYAESRVLMCLALKKKKSICSLLSKRVYVCVKRIQLKRACIGHERILRGNNYYFN